MISVDEALQRVLERARPGASQTVPSSQARGCVVARHVACTLDSPPYDKSLVDGYAVRLSGLAEDAELRVIEQVTAGQVPSLSLAPGTAIRIMTGAAIPQGADAVVMVERTESFTGSDACEWVRIRERHFRTGQNIMRRGESMRRGSEVLRPGHRLRAIEIGLLAELGVTTLDVFPLPSVAILSTGDELVPWDAEPAAGQIRNSNGPMLRELVAEAGGEPRDLGIARDTADDLARQIRSGLDSDVLLLSGGVSAGVLDLVPQVLHGLGVAEVFHKVNLRPGKPLWFGVSDGNDGSRRLVFGLPGNPVSSLVCFHLFVRPALRALAGELPRRWPWFTATLAVEHHHRSDRPTYHPGRSAWQDGEWLVEPLAWRGSADLRTLADADVLIHFSGQPHLFREGERVAVFWI